MQEPSVRGSILRGVVEDLLRQCDLGHVDPARIETELEARDLAILQEKIADGAWYPATTYNRVLELLCRTVGGGGRIFYAQRGAANAQRLMDAGFYSELALVERLPQELAVFEADEEARFERMAETFRSKLAHIVSLADTIYSMGRWSVVEDPDTARRLCIEVEEAADYTEPMRHAIEGFFNQCVRNVPGREPIMRLFRAERLAPDHIRIRMTMDLRELLARV